jgi:hypothetical protein
LWTTLAIFAAEHGQYQHDHEGLLPRAMRYLIFFFAVGLLRVHCGAQAPAKTDICKVFEDPLQFKGTLIEVRGVVHNRDAPTVGSDTCPKRLVVGKFTLRNEILLEPTGKALSSQGKASFAELTSEFEKFDPASQEIFATFAGVFETRESLSDLVKDHGEIFGFGPLSRAPGQLLLREVRDISVMAKPDAPPTHSVCDLLENPLNFNGKLVAVKGLIQGGDGFWIYDDQCPPRIRVQGRTYENIIAIANPTMPLRLHDAEFDTDDDSVALIGRAFGQDKTMRPQVSATLVGLFETRPGLNLTAPNGSSLGFGHLGRAPAELLLKECRGATVTYVPMR